MRKETDLGAVQQMAILFLNMKPEKPEGELGKVFVIHPILETNMIILQSTGEFFNIFEDSEKYEIWLGEMKEFFENCDSVDRIMCHIRKSYRLTFFKYINKYLSAKDFALLLKDVWIMAENISDDKNVSMKELVKWFKMADKRYLLDKKEKKLLSELPNGVSVYRGVRSEDYKYDMSWTLSLENAKWFAERYNTDTQIVYKAVIQKQDILAYLNDRNEEEVIIDPVALKKYNIEEVEL